MSKKGSLLVLLMLFCFMSNAQNRNDSLCLNFKVNFNKVPIQLQHHYITTNNDTIALETFRCYITSIQIQYADNTVFNQKNSYHLLDIENPKSLIIPICKNNSTIISKVLFTIGIDSLTNTSGALSGDLDPTKGMYWAWQSGYINMKMEGKSSSCKTRKHEFQFHIGGYLSPYNAIRKLAFNYDKSATEINIGIDLKNLFSKVKLSETNSVMIPGKQAMQLADYSKELFYIE